MGDNDYKSVNSFANGHVAMYAKPLKFLGNTLGLNDIFPKLNASDTPNPTKRQQFFNVCPIPLTAPLACFAALTLIICGLCVLHFGLFMFFFCFLCIICQSKWSKIIEGVKVTIWFIFGGLSVMIYAIILFALWPLLMIVCGVRACCCYDPNCEMNLV